MIQKRLSWFPFIVLLAGLGCSNANQGEPEGRIVSPKLPGSSVSSPTAGTTAGGEDGGGLTTGGTGSEGTDDASSEQDPALIMHIINSTLN